LSVTQRLELVDAPARRVASLSRRDGFYRLHIDGEERRFVSVTKVLEVLSKPALITWAARSAASLVLDDPFTFDSAEKAASGIYAKRDDAASRGSTVHSALEAYIHKPGELKVASIPGRFRGFVQAGVRWLHDVSPEVITAEMSCYSTEHGYAGTTDLACRIRGVVALVDFKTGKDIYREAHLQLAAYGACDLWLPKVVRHPECNGEGCPTCGGNGRIKPELRQALNVERLAVVLLQDNGRYRFAEVDAPLEVFLALKRVWEWQHDSE
jgi:hypothetical protein